MFQGTNEYVGNGIQIVIYQDDMLLVLKLLKIQIDKII